MSKPFIYCFVGASGTGKTTLLNYINENFNIKTKELSARDYLPKDGPYDKTLTDDTQILIAQHRFLSVVEAYIAQKPIIFSRSPIDNLAYQKVLNKGRVLDSIIEREINIFKNHIILLYLPIEFEMEETTDIIRGTNKEVQKATDNFIWNFLCDNMNISNVHIIKGDILTRLKQLDQIFLDYAK